MDELDQKELKNQELREEVPQNNQEELVMEDNSMRQEYLKSICIQQLLTLSLENESKQALSQAGIKQDLEKKILENIHLKIVSESINREVIVLNVAWGSFSSNINILNVAGDNTKHGVVLQNGGFGCVYCGFYRKTEMIIKCVAIVSENGRKKAIQQWFITKIASALKFGPKMIAYFGFDMIMYQSCAQFAIERCQQIKSDKVSKIQLYQNLALMHKLHLVHLDIKPENIMFSPSYNKTIFIDFGLSKFTKDEIGQKSLTNFRGCLDYCSAQMIKCFVDEKKNPVDLYFNDLCCLKKSIKEIQELSQQSSEQDQPDFLKEKINSFQYCHLFSIKFMLFTLQVQDCLVQWNKEINSMLKKDFISDILQFLLQLPPCQTLKQFFIKVTDQSLMETQTYSKIKLIYQTAQQRLCAIDLLRNDQKKNIFQTYCFQQIIDKNTQLIVQSQNARQPTLVEYMKNEEQIKKISFDKYVGMYLEYSSYMNNKCKITFKDREKAAIFYYSLFVSAQRPSQLQGKALIKKNIQHIFEWILNLSQFEDSNQFAILIFRFFDFVLILFSETSEQLIKTLSLIYNHNLLNHTFKVLLLMKVKYCKNFITFRLFINNDQPRIDISNALIIWVQQQIEKSQYFELIKYKILKEYQTAKKERSSIISQKFMDEFGSQIVQFWKIKDESARTKNPTLTYQRYVELFNRITATSQHLKIYNFLLTLYSYGLTNHINLPLCKKIFSIVKNNFADPTLISEYVFQVELNLLFPIKHSDNNKIKKETLIKLNEEMMKIKEKDFLLLNHLLFQDFYKMYHAFVRHQLITEETTNFFTIQYNCLIKNVFNKLFNQVKENHLTHISVLYLYNLRIMRSQMQKSKKLDQIFTQQQLVNVKCVQCKTNAQFHCKIQMLFEFIDHYARVMGTKKSQILSDQEGIVQKYAKYSQKIQKELCQANLSLNVYVFLMEIILSIKFQFCQKSYFLQEKCHGILDYFRFSLKYNNFKNYFPQHYSISTGILSTFLLFYRQYYDSFIIFLEKLIDFLQKSLLYRDFVTLDFYFTSFLKHHQKLIDKIFKDLKHYQIQNKKTNGYIAVLYAILFKSSLSRQSQNKIIASIISQIGKILPIFQREIGIMILQKILSDFKLVQHYKQNRYFLFYSSKLLKLLMIEGKTKPTSFIIPQLSSKKLMLKSKISKFQKISSHHLNLKIQVKKNKI